MIFVPLCAAKTTAFNSPTHVLPLPSSAICLPVVVFNAAALYCRLLFILFAEASVNQMSSADVPLVRGGAFKIGEGLKGCCNANGPAFIGIYNLETLLCPSVHFISSTITVK